MLKGSISTTMYPSKIRSQAPNDFNFVSDAVGGVSNLKFVD